MRCFRRVCRKKKTDASASSEAVRGTRRMPVSSQAIRTQTRQGVGEQQPTRRCHDVFLRGGAALCAVPEGVNVAGRGLGAAPPGGRNGPGWGGVAAERQGARRRR
jgi:hypothetical protein